MALIILGDASSIGSLHNIIVPYKDQYRIGCGHGGVVIGNTIDNRLFSTGTVVLAGTNVTIGTSALGARQYLNLSVADIQERSLRFIDSHGVSWGSAVNGYTTSVTASVEAGINSSLLGSIYFNDANGVTWGSATSGNSTTITASVNTAGGGGGGAALQGSGTYTQNTGTIQFANSNGISFGLASNRMTASVANNAGNLYFSDGQGISFGVSTSGSSTTVTGSVIGGTMSGEYAGTVFSTSSVTGSNIRGSANTAGISLSVPNYVTRTGSLLFANNSGNITWSSSVNNNSTYVYGSAPVGGGSGTYDVSHTHGNVSGINISATSASNGLTLSVPNYLTTAALSNHSHGNVSLALTNLSATASSRSNGLTLSLSSPPPASGGGIAVQGSGTYIHTSGTVRFVNSNGLTFGLATNGSLTGSVANNVGSMYFSDANGVSFGVSSNTNNQSTITASFNAGATHTHPYMGTGVSSSGNITVMGNTAGLSITAPVLGFLYFSNANGHSWSSSTSGVSTSIYICT